MSNQLTTFDFNTLSVRVVEREGEPWFVAADVLRALGMDSRQSQNYLRNIGSEEKKVVCITQGKGNPNKTILAESGLYKLIMRSDKPETLRQASDPARTHAGVIIFCSS